MKEVKQRLKEELQLDATLYVDTLDNCPETD